MDGHVPIGASAEAIEQAIAEVGGGGASQSRLEGALASDIFPDLVLRTGTVIDPEDTGVLGFVETLPPFTYGAGVIARFGVWTITRIDTRTKVYDASVAVLVTNANGSQNLLLSGSAAANAGVEDDSVSIGPGDVSISDQVGDDLDYDSESGEISSSAGGSYSVVVSFGGRWD